jgi:hypothetical protein
MEKLSGIIQAREGFSSLPRRQSRLTVPQPAVMAVQSRIKLPQPITCEPLQKLVGDPNGVSTAHCHTSAR